MEKENLLITELNHRQLVEGGSEVLATQCRNPLNFMVCELFQSLQCGCAPDKISFERMRSRSRKIQTRHQLLHQMWVSYKSGFLWHLRFSIVHREHTRSEDVRSTCVADSRNSSVLMSVQFVSTHQWIY